jgi:hypothetical protein
MGKEPQEIIKLSERWRVTKLDALNCQLEELRTINGKVDGQSVDREQWCWVGFHGSLHSALSSALSRQVVDEPGGVQHLIDKIAYWGERFEAAVKSKPLPAAPVRAVESAPEPRPKKRRRTPT